MSRTAVCDSFCSSSSNWSTCACTVTSSADVGSSAMTSAGEEQRDREHYALAHATREFVRVGPVACCRVGQADSVEHRDGLVAGARRAALSVHECDLGHLVANAHHRIERRRWLLKHHRNPSSAEVTKLALRKRQEITSLKAHGAAGPNARVARKNPHDGERCCRLAAAGLAHERDDLAGLDRERQVDDGPAFARAVGVRHPQVVDREKRCHGQIRVRSWLFMVPVSCGRAHGVVRQGDSRS